MPGAVVLDDAFDPPPSRPQPENPGKPSAPKPVTDEVSTAKVAREAAIGDVVLRALVLSLGGLLGTMFLTDTRPLVSVRAAEAYLDAGSIWIEEPFSFLVENYSWRNPSWAFDLIVKAVYEVGEWKALSIATAAVAITLVGVLVLMRWGRISTWPGSILCFLAVLAVWPVFQATPDLVTPFFLAIVFAVDHLMRAGRLSTGLVWLLPLLCVIAVQLDDDAALVTIVAAVLAARQAVVGGSRRPSGIAAACCLLGPLVHPFPGIAWSHIRSELMTRSPIRSVAGHEFPFADYLAEPIWAIDFWNGWSLSSMAAVLLAMIGLLTLITTRRIRSVDAGLMLGAILLGCLCGHFWPASAVIICVTARRELATWYDKSFAPLASSDHRTLLFGRIGRSLTAAVMLLPIGLAATGRLPCADGRRVGLGYSPDRRVAIEGTADLLDEVGHDFRAFHLRIEQGDLLIWSGGRSLVDSRLELFLPQTLPSYLTVRSRLAGGAIRPDIIYTDLRTLGIDGIVPRLYGESPDYDSFNELDFSRLYVLTNVTAAAACFTPRYAIGRRESDLEPIRFVKREFEVPGDAPLTPPRRPVDDESDLWRRIFRPLAHVTTDGQLSRHYGAIALQGRFNRLYLDLSAAYTQLRLAARSVAADPEQPVAWRSLMSAYRTIQSMESEAIETAPYTLNPSKLPGLIDESDPRSDFENWLSEMRHYQEMHAATRYIRLFPGEYDAYRALIQTHALLAQPEPALYWNLATVKRFGQVQNPASLASFDLESFERGVDMLRERIDLVRTGLDRMVNQRRSVAEVARSALQRRCPLLALQYIGVLDAIDAPLQRDAVDTLSSELAVLATDALLKLGRSQDARLTMARVAPDDAIAPELRFWLALSEADFEAALAEVDGIARIPAITQRATRLALLLEQNDRQAAAALAASAAGQREITGMLYNRLFVRATEPNSALEPQRPGDGARDRSRPSVDAGPDAGSTQSPSEYDTDDTANAATAGDGGTDWVRQLRRRARQALMEARRRDELPAEQREAIDAALDRERELRPQRPRADGQREPRSVDPAR